MEDVLKTMVDGGELNKKKMNVRIKSSLIPIKTKWFHYKSIVFLNVSEASSAEMCRQ